MIREKATPMKMSIVFLALVALGFANGASAQTKSAAAQPDKIFNRNLLKNGDGEAVTDDAHTVPGWPKLDDLTYATYGGIGGEWDHGLSGCKNCGKQYLRLEFMDKKESSASQTLDVASAAEEIDTSKVMAAISGYLGAYIDSDTTTLIHASFEDKDGKELATISTEPVNTATLPKAERGSTGLSLVQKKGPVPAGTRKIVYTWTARAAGDSNSYLGLADNLSLVLTLAE